MPGSLLLAGVADVGYKGRIDFYRRESRSSTNLQFANSYPLAQPIDIISIMSILQQPSQTMWSYAPMVMCLPTIVLPLTQSLNED